ncbi:unnamed protein product [Mytilus edulis]|uniref:Uncharacterized protein n=1 Tax=Mytilus edulis TaxID=6550 RepID=A0A8S3QPF0_MYTED|nr:unnamed protein product [Mytilus edulis]
MFLIWNWFDPTTVNFTYTKARKHKYREYKQSLLKQIETLHEENPKQYWQLIDELQGKEKDDKSALVAPFDWLNHFKNLTEPKDEFKEEKLNILEKRKCFNELDSRISETEISTALSSLKMSEPDLYDFMRSRNIKDDIITTLIEEKVREFEIKLTDTYFQNIDLQSTVESCYNRLKMRQLRFNFCTEGTSSTIESDELPPLSLPKNRNATASAQSEVIEVMEIIDLPPTCLSKPEKSNDIFVTNDFFNAELPDIRPNFDISDFSFDGDIVFGPNVRASNVSLDSTLPLESGSGDILDRPLEFGDVGTVERKIIRIHRASALMDMIIHFKDPNITTVDIDAIMVLDNGKEEAGEGDGVFRDCITQFWDEFYEQSTEGRIFKVPVLRHDFQKEEWKAVSRIIRKGFEVSGYWPISIMPAIFEECIHGSIESSLIELFSDYLPEMESQIVKKAISNFNDVDQDDFLEFLDSHSCRKLVNSENVLPIIG